MKYLVVTGGVISGVGKGILASSAALLLKTMGLKVTMAKIDPYLSLDAGLMRPSEHGEVFVLSDGGEVDLDLGNYERYLNITLTYDHSITTGKMYKHVMDRERAGYYLGETVQIIPHLTDAIQEWIERIAQIPVDETGEKPDVCVIEVGGTIGDIENAPFVEALKMLQAAVGDDNFLHIHVSFVPVIHGEQKTKPTQQSIRNVRSAGLSPDLIACRCKDKLDPVTIQKISRHCQVKAGQVLVVHDVESTYLVPSVLKNQGLLQAMGRIFNINQQTVMPDAVNRGSLLWNSWKIATALREHAQGVTIALVGKYTNHADAYMSLVKSLEHSAMACNRNLSLVLIDASDLESSASGEQYDKAWAKVRGADGILVPGGFGPRGTGGMVEAIKYARENKVPFLGICLGMQMAVVEFARNMCNLPDATSTEFDENAKEPLVIDMPELDKEKMGGTMRLGLRPTYFQPGSEFSKVRKMYTSASSGKSAEKMQEPGTVSSSIPVGDLVILERHRHRFEVNPAYVLALAEHGLNFVGKDDRGERMEILELKDHPWFVGVQYHPEYISKVLGASRPILGFVSACAGCFLTI